MAKHEKLCQRHGMDKPCPEVCGEMCNLWLSDDCLLAPDKTLCVGCKQLQAENKRLREALEGVQRFAIRALGKNSIYCFPMTDIKELAEQALRQE